MSYISNRNLVDSGNSTSTLLNAGITFTGTWKDVSGRFSGIEFKDVDA
jgi:hypothetical protein